MMDSKIEIHRDLDALLINFANRHEFHGSGTFFFESDLFDRKAMNFITREDESIKPRAVMIMRLESRAVIIIMRLEPPLITMTN